MGKDKVKTKTQRERAIWGHGVRWRAQIPEQRLFWERP